MSVMLSLRKHLYLKRVGILFIAAVLVFGVVGCDGTTPTEYDLTMAASPTAGGTATDETGTSPYAEDTDVSIKAVANAGYVFAGWTAPAGAFADANAAETTFTMPAEDVTVTANFVALYDLTMAVNPVAGGTATDETGTSPYAEDTDVSIKAVANVGYEFDSWTAPAGAFADADAAETTFTMPGQDVTVTAHFVLVYDLTMAASPAGGGTATDETGTSPYPAGTDVDVKAVANPPYQFFKWTAPAGAFTDENAAETTFTMPAEDVTATANFVGPLDHATVYVLNWETAPYIGEEVYLEDQFATFNATVEYGEGFAIPAEKLYNDETTPILNPDHCLTIYAIDCEEEPGRWLVDVENQFGTQTLVVEGPYGLAVPTQNEGHEEPLGLDHYLLYEVIDYTYLDDIFVELNDELLGEPLSTQVYNPIIFANPVRKTHGADVTEIRNPDVHGVLYVTDWGDVLKTVDVANQFGEQTLDVDGPCGFIVPSQKIAWEPVPEFDHFRMYEIDPGTQPYVGEVVQLKDQFHDEPFDAFVEEAVAFCNPVDKDHDLYWPSYHWNYHLMVYSLYYEELPWVYEVTVDNQFGEGQVLYVYGPVALAVPTHKLFPDDFGPPEGLDHFLLYQVVDYTVLPDVFVELWDQFTWEPEVLVFEPDLFANPVQKTFLGEVTEIEHPDWHMVFYDTGNPPLDLPVEVWIDNQFGVQGFTVTLPYSLGVPSQKVDWVPLGPI